MSKQQDPRVIKRYANRKLYDTSSGSFTTVDELSRLLDKGVRFVVRDHDSGGDRTDEVLAQVLGRRVRTGSGGTDLLSGLLRTPGQIAQQLVDEAAGAKAGPPAKAKPTPAKKKSKAKAKKSQTDKDADKDKLARQQREIEELRAQVSELTQAVSLLVQDRLAEREAE